MKLTSSLVFASCSTNDSNNRAANRQVETVSLRESGRRESCCWRECVRAQTEQRGRQAEIKGRYLVRILKCRRRIVLWCVYTQGASRLCLTVSLFDTQVHQSDSSGIKNKRKNATAVPMCLSFILWAPERLNKIFIGCFHQKGQTEHSVRGTSEYCGE